MTGPTLSMRKAPLRPVRVGPSDMSSETRADGSIIIRSRSPLLPYPGRLTEKLEYWAKAAPDRTYLAQRRGDGWRRLSFAEALAGARAIGEALLDRGLTPERPLAILSGNSIEHGLLALGALNAGVPYAPISPAYSLLSKDHGQLREIFAMLNPGLIFAADGAAFGPVLASVVPAGIETITGGEGGFDALLATTPTARIDAAAAKVGPDTIAKFLFTSGSTGQPKAVINTQRMLCSNQQMILQGFAFMADEPPVILDWSPWHHTAGGNHNFGLALYNGGTLYIDDGKPTPAAIGETVRNLREIAPTWYFTVPKGYEALLPHFRADAALRQNFFSRLRMIYVAGSGVTQPVWEAYNRMALETCGERILFGSGIGSTETAPYALVCTWEQEHADNCGLPAPGLTLKLAPQDGRFEARVKAPSVTPGYWKEPALTAAAFDEEGFYRLGDALRFADRDDLSKGLLFDGRLAENFKLSTGTWVSVGALRARLLNHFAPLVSDAVIAGLNQDFLAALLVLNLDACRAFAGQPGASIAELAVDQKLSAELGSRLSSLAAQATGSSFRIERALVLTEPPTLETGELTDKGSINQRAVLRRREALVANLYAEPPSAEIISASVTP